MSIVSIKDIPYIPNSTENKHCLDLYIPPFDSRISGALLVYVHGGAWKVGDKSEYAWLGERFAMEGFCVAVVNYRLSLKHDNDTQVPEDHMYHPGHVNDVSAAIEFLCVAPEIKSHLGMSPRLYLLGHSAGAQLTGSIIMKGSPISANAYSSIKGIAGIEGIYDIPFMCEKWPTYAEWFVENAFGKDRDVWKQASPQYIDHQLNSIVPYMLLYSDNDELLDKEQTTRYADSLHKRGYNRVYLDLTSLKGSHDGVLKEDALYSVIKDFVLGIEKND